MHEYDEKYRRLAKILIDRMEEMTPEDFQAKQEYTDLLKQYLKVRNKDLEDDYNDVIPREFEVSDNTEEKIKILKDCLANGSDIESCKYYIDLLEGTKVPEEVPPTK